MSFFFAEHKKKQNVLPIKVLHILGCSACTLNNESDRLHPKMEPSGNPSADFYIVGGHPDFIADQQGVPLQNRWSEYERLHALIPEQFHAQLRFGYVVRDVPWDKKGAIRQPTELEIECCRPLLERDIEETRPTMIIVTDEIALYHFIGETSLVKNRGRFFPVQVGNHTCWLTCLFLNPVYQQEEYQAVVKRDIRMIFSDSGIKQKRPCVVGPKDRYTDLILETQSLAKIRKILVEMTHRFEPIVFDIETTGLRPYGDGKILSIAFGNTHQTVAFPLQHPSATWDHYEYRELKKLVRWILEDAAIEKVAHNVAFELEWCGYVFGTQLFQREIVFHDTLAQAYVLDARRGGMSLDYLINQYFGFRLKDEMNIDQTQLESADLDSVLKYNALDVKWTARLFAVQSHRLRSEQLWDTYLYHQQRIAALVQTQLRGLCVNTETLYEYDAKLQQEQEDILTQLRQLPDVKKYERQQRQRFDPLQTMDVVIPFFRDFLKSKIGFSKKNVSGYSVDKHVLKRIDHPAAKLIQDFRHVNKLRSTYIMPYLEEYKDEVKDYWIQPDQKIHTVYHHTFTQTGRLSSSNPNVQNFPREEGWIRNFVVPRSEHVFVRCDYGQIEARIVATISQDPFLMKALWENYDIHQEWAEKFARRFPQLTQGKFDTKSMKAFRSVIKNTLVFPAIYGSECGSIAKSLMLKESQVFPLYEEFWETFKGIRRWQEKVIDFYNKHLYIESVFGRRYLAPLTKNQILNYDVQGPASDLQVDAHVRLTAMAHTRENTNFIPILSVHDELAFQLPRHSFDTDGEVIVTEMLRTELYPWLTVPLTVEVSSGPTWHEQEKVGTFCSHEL